MLNLRQRFKLLSICLALSSILSACASYQEHAARRTARLREIYPQGTSRKQVQAKWGQINPDFSASRPPNGWEVYQSPFVRTKLANVERNTGKRVDLVERYWGPDGLWSLCYCWYFYDSEDRIVDVEWQYKSD
jgi:hypothetical protein